jgi:methylmalonyl-CoA mutase cobalamin-binding subunit
MPTLERIFNEVQAYYPSDLITSRLIAPLLNTLGMRWQTDAGGIAEEHFFSVFIRNKLGARFHHLAQDGKRGILVTACLPGEFHDLGVMLFGLSAASRGYRLIQLGANMPLAETAIAAHRAGANGIVLSGSANVWSPLLGAELAQLAINIDLPILIGGVIVESYRQELNDCGVHILGRELPQAMAILERKVK